MWVALQSGGWQVWLDRDSPDSVVTRGRILRLLSQSQTKSSLVVRRRSSQPFRSQHLKFCNSSLLQLREFRLYAEARSYVIRKLRLRTPTFVPRYFLLLRRFRLGRELVTHHSTARGQIN
jgi:hypothetical protein